MKLCKNSSTHQYLQQTFVLRDQEVKNKFTYFYTIHIDFQQFLHGVKFANFTCF